MMRNSLNQAIAAKIERIATAAIRAIGECGKGDDYKTDAKGFEDTLRPQEGVLPRRATLLGPESEDRYRKGKPVHDASGKFRRSDAKG
jgi:hypothetical protein